MCLTVFNMLAVHQLSNPCEMLVPQGGARPSLWLNHEDKSLHRISKTSCGTCTPCSTREAMAGCLWYPVVGMLHVWLGCWMLEIKRSLCWISLGIFMGYKWGYCSNMMVLIDIISGCVWTRGMDPANCHYTIWKTLEKLGKVEKSTHGFRWSPVMLRHGLVVCCL